MSTVLTLSFGQSDLGTHLAELSAEQIDGLAFGVIGFDGDTVVRAYNATESRLAGLSPSRVIGQALFTAVAPCMNNYMVAQRFQDAAADGSGLDATIDYVLTLRMRPVKVKLRLIAKPGAKLRYVVVDRA